MTGTSSTSICSVMAPLAPCCKTAPLRSRLGRLFWFLIPTRSYEFGLGLRAFRLGLFDLLVLHIFFDGGHERLGEVRQFGLLVRRKRFDEMRRDHHQQFIRRFLGRAAAEELPQ